MDTLSSLLNSVKCELDDDLSQTSAIDSVSSTQFNKKNFKEGTGRGEWNPSLPEIVLDENIESKCSDDNTDVVLSVFWKRGKLGAAYYTCHDSELHILNDVVDVQPEFSNLKTLLHQVQPSQVLTCGGLSDTFVKALSEAINGIGGGDIQGEDTSEMEEQPKNIFFMSAKRKDLSYESCKRYILGLRLGFEPESLSEEDHILFINSHIDLRQESMVISLGMLVKYLEKYLPQINLSHGLVEFMFLNHISLENLVVMDEDTYKALQIFNERVHPSAFKRSAPGSNREGLSVFGIFSRCKSRAGIKRMRELFTNPSRDIEKLNERLEAVEFCCKPQHQHIVQNLIDCLKKVEGVTGVLARIYKTRANITHWRSLYSSLYNSILIGEICHTHSSQAKLFERAIHFCHFFVSCMRRFLLGSSFIVTGEHSRLECLPFVGKLREIKHVAKSITQDVHEVAHYMNRVIDFDESSLKNHFTVRSGIDRKLDLLRQTYSQIPEVLVKVAQTELEDLPSFIEQCSVVYITELGYLLSVPVWKGDGTDTSEYSLPDFEVKFIVNNFVHYKTPRCAELDNAFGDSIASISNIESRIMITLIQFITTKTNDIIKAFRLISELDCIMAFALVASENNYRRPVLTTERKLEIIQGRHPLQELCIDNFVPNDAYFDLTEKRIKILTGPNASGKSIYLKQVALIAYLAHVGSFVPAQSAVIGILDHIHSRIQSVESVSTRMSAFLLDLKQMSLALYNSTPSSLIIIDEFGKGTTEIDGLSLLAASLIHFIEREGNCPFILVSTHYHNLPELLPTTPLVHLQYMDYLIENQEVIYLHKIKEGASGTSLTLLAAKAAGLGEDAINRSLQILKRSAPLAPNPKLNVTKIMMKEVAFMEKIFQMYDNENNDSKMKTETQSIIQKN